MSRHFRHIEKSTTRVEEQTTPRAIGPALGLAAAAIGIAAMAIFGIVILFKAIF